ncbi:MAG: SLC13 family permease [Candidatus Thorarchaeota archaeon]
MAITSLIPIVALGITFILIIVRKVGGYNIKIWQAMLLGAILVLVTGQIFIVDAILSINLDVMLFLFGMFVIGSAMEKSGYLSRISAFFFGRARNVDQLILMLLFVMGMLSALLMNDTLAIIGTPIVLGFAKRYRISTKLLLLTLAFAVTTGSVLSPIGNPQNLLVATQGGFENPFITFMQYLFLPTMICILIAYTFLRVFYRKEFKTLEIVDDSSTTHDNGLTRLSKISFVLVFILIIAKIALIFILPDFDFRLTYIALIACLPVLIGSSRRVEIVHDIDWETLVFFASMFILMTSVWNSGVIQFLLEDYTSLISSVPVILFLSVTLSQVLSNVPLVALYLPLLTEASASIASYVALAAGSTIAGNMFILGAASNVIIIQNAERNGETISFWEFARIGVPLTIVQLLIYVLFLGI